MVKIADEPVKFTTSSGTEVKLRPFVSARMSEETRDVFLRYGKLDQRKIRNEKPGEDVTSFGDGIPANIITEINRITIRRMVLEVGGVTDPDQILDYILDNLQSAEMDEIIAECNRIAEDTSIDDTQKKG